MATDPSTSVAAVDHHPHDLVAEVVADFQLECRALSGVADAVVLFRNPLTDAFEDEGGRERVAPGAVDHPVTQAVATGRPVPGAWPGDDQAGVAYPVRALERPETAVWFALADSDEATGADARFLFEGVVSRLGRELGRAAHTWSDEQRRAALAFVEEVSRRALQETSLHRALRLNAGDLAELSGAKDVSVWRFERSNAPECIAQVTQGSVDAGWQRTLERLVADVQATPASISVSRTDTSTHFGYCDDAGISRVLVEPFSAYDAVHGCIVVIDYAAGMPFLGAEPVPGVREALTTAANVAATALHQVRLQDRVAGLERDLHDHRRRVERLERDGARFDLCKAAASALEECLTPLDEELPGVTAATSDTEADARSSAVRRRMDRAIELLEEFAALTRSEPARLRLSDINDVVYEATETLRDAEPGRPAADVSLRLQGDLPPLLLDVARIRTVLVTLLRHGLSGVDDGEAIVTTRLQSKEVVVELRIPGRRVAGGILESLFRPFGPGEPGSADHGLSLADQIVNEHGGQLRARSESGDGLLYWLSLPIAENPERRARRTDRRGRERRNGGGD